MKSHKFSLLLIIIPLFILGWGLFYFYFFDPFYAYSPDPEYCYLINGLNMALLEFNRIGHYDHPGTTFQLYNGIIIHITHFFAGKDSIAQDVFNRPEYYLSAINLSLIIIQSLLCFLIAWVGKKREIKTWQLIILQSGVLISTTMLSIFCRVTPERWIVVTAFLFIIVYLLYGYGDRRPLKFAIWSGVIMGMGMATKFNFLPIILLPFLLIDSNKNRLVYSATGIASFFFFLLPVINKFHSFRKFMVNIATHDGFYGKGEERMFDPERLLKGFSQIFDSSPELIFIIIAVISALIIAVIYRKKQKTNRNILFFAGMLFIVLLQILMVAKHFKFYYILPLLAIYPLILFIFDSFIQKTGSYKKWTQLPVILLFVIFISITAKQTYRDIKYTRINIAQREIERQFISDNLPANTLWFVVTPSWMGAPYVENAFNFALCYIHHPVIYFPELSKKSPNIITNDKSDEFAWIWRGHKVHIDSIITTRTPIHLYSSKGRETSIFIDILEKAALRNDINLSRDTMFSNHKKNSHIIVIQNKNSIKEWNTERYISTQ